MHNVLAAIVLLFAANPVAPLKNGEIVDSVACASDPSITYAYYLPSRYTSQQRWPVLFVFDPRRRGAYAAGLFREAAEKYGWIIVSSNHTESDADPQPSIKAIQTTLPDAQRKFSIDTKRIYVAGFSGTAIIAWAVADATKSVAGMIGCSGRPLPQPNYDIPFAWFGTTGDHDFNNMETREIDRGLAAAGATHHLEVFDGGHRWAPPDVIRQAFEWFELLAMKSNTRTKDDTFIAQRYADQFARAEAEKDPVVAVRRYESIVRTFDGLTAVDAARDRAKTIAASREYANAKRDEKRADDFEQSHRRSAAKVIQQFVTSDTPEVAASLARSLEIPSLRQLATKPTHQGRAAQRVLEGIYVQLDFYWAQDATGAKLAVMKAVAAMIHPPS